ncbi:FliM/FliN family flagellar motor switch protein [Arsenophonus apicola]|uniref:Surface presentation of antigens protein SpaO n=1 Tax=Arsenophonus apicola TaxID=2879119 RepID=A0ABY8P2W5_9GAMM|nr:FliM/FliN family flagellar motor switch protein [Arsenophonus apicola]WGO83852.1 FliM/FliN family flagellar motor switch protein [Arsenophonus apicola]
MKGKLSLRASRHTDKTPLFHILAANYPSEKIITDSYCFVLLLQQSKLQLTVYLPIEVALRQYLTMLAPLPWLAIPASYLIELLQEQLTTISIPQLGEFQIQVTQFDCLQQPIEAIRIASSLGQILIVDANGSAPLKENDYANLPLQVRFSIGYSRLKQQLFCTLQTGDILLLQQSQTYLSVETIPLFHYTWQPQGNIMLAQPIVTDQDDHNASSESSPAIFDLNQLSLKVNFILQRQTFSLNTIKSWQSGTQLMLNSDAHCAITLEINGQTFAKGELIQVGEQLAVELHTLLSSKQEG